MKAHPKGKSNGSGTLPSGPPLAIDWQRKAAEEYERTLSITAACRAAGVARGTYYKYLQTDPGFKEMIDDAYAAAKDRLQSSAYERAVNGTKVVREFYDKTGRVSSAVETTNYETQLTIKMLESHMPETYRKVERRELTGLNGGEIEIELLEKERIVLTGIVQKLLDHGWTVRLALQHLNEMNIPLEKLKLVRGEDLRIPEVIDVEVSEDTD